MPEEDGFEIASAWASISPDASDFQDRLDEELGGVVATVRVLPDMSDFASAVDEDGIVVTIPVTADLSRFGDQVDEETSGLSAVVAVSGDTAPLRSGVENVLSEIDSSSATVGLGIDPSRAREQADAITEEFSGLSADLNIGAQTGDASAGVEHLTGDLEQLSAAAGQATSALSGTNSVTASLEAAADHLGTSLAAVSGGLGNLAPVSVAPDLSGFDEALSEGTGGSEAHVRIVPDAGDFDQAVAEETAGTTVPVMLVPDAGDFQERVAEITGGLTATITLEADTGPAEASIAEFSGASAEAFGEVEASAASAGAAIDDALRPSGALSSMPAASQASIDAFNGLTAAADESAALIEDDFTSVEARAAELGAQLSALDADFLRMANAQFGPGTDAELADMTSAFENLYGELGSAQGELAGLRSQLAEAGGEFAGMDSGLGSVSGSLNNFEGSLAGTKAALGDMSLGFFTDEEAAARFGVTLDELPAKVDAMDAQLAASADARAASLAVLNGEAGAVAGVGAAAESAAPEIGGLVGALGGMAANPFLWMMAAPPLFAAVESEVMKLTDTLGPLDAAADSAAKKVSFSVSSWDDLAAAQQRVADTGDALSGGIYQQFADQSRGYAETVTSALGTLENRYNLTAAQAEALASASGVTAKQLAGIGESAGKALGSVESYGDANLSAAGSVGELSGDMAEFSNEALSAETRVSGLSDSFNLLAGNFVGAQEAQLSVTSGFNSIRQAAAQAGASMTGTNSASVTLQQAFYSQVGAVEQAADAMTKQGDSAQQVTGYISDQTTKLSALTGGNSQATAAIQNLKQWEDNLAASTRATTAVQDQAASDMASKFTAQVRDAGDKSSTTKSLIDKLTTSIEKTGTTSQGTQSLRQQLIDSLHQAGIKASTAKDDVDGFIKKIGQIPKSTAWKLTESASGTWSMSELLATGHADVPGLPGYQAPASGSAHAGGLGGSQANVSGLAGGGLVLGGSGSPKADDISARLSHREYVMPTAAVDKYGVGMMDDIRTMRFADGGLADGSYSGNATGLGTWNQNQYKASVSALASALVGDASAASSARASAARAASYSGGSPSGSGASNAQLAKSLVPQWASGDAWAAWNSVAMAESGWSNTAQNPSSGAFGIGQALPYTKMPKAAWPVSAGGSADAGTQITWMRDYIAGRYGTPQGAAQHEAQYHWYKDGGHMRPGETGVVGDAGPELYTAGPSGGTVTPLGKGGATVIQQFYGPQYPTPEQRASMALEAAVSLIGAP